MQFTSKKFIKLCYDITIKGSTINLLEAGNGVGFFEIIPFKTIKTGKNGNVITIEYTITDIIHNSNGIILKCKVRLSDRYMKPFDLGECFIHENLFLSCVKTVWLDGNFDSEIMKFCDIYRKK